MREYSIEEQIVIDKQIDSLKGEEKILFLENYKVIKNEYLFIALAFTLSFFAAPILYLRGKFIPGIVIFAAIMNIVVVIFGSFFIGLFIGLFNLYIGLFFIWMILIIFVQYAFVYYVYIHNFQHFKRSFDFYEYNEKVRVLKMII